MSAPIIGSETLTESPTIVQLQRHSTGDFSIECAAPDERSIVVSPAPNRPRSAEAGAAGHAPNDENLANRLGNVDRGGDVAGSNLPDLSFSTRQPFSEITTQPEAPVEQPVHDMSIGDELDLLWNDFDMYSSLNMSQPYPLNVSALSQAGFPGLDVFFGNNIEYEVGDRQRDENDVNASDVMSRFESRLPSMQPEEHTNDWSKNDLRQGDSAHPSQSARRVPWRLSNQDYHVVSTVIQSHRDVLPSDFTLPSRHALCRYLEGFFTGFHEHLPVIHLPTFSLVNEAPEHILAIAAVGARYRFQRRQSHQLYLAARTLLEHQLRRRDAYDVPDSVFSTPGALSDGNIQSHSNLSPMGDATTFEHPPSRRREPKRPDPATIERDMQTMHAMILLIALGTWNHCFLIRDAFSTASQLSLLVHEYISYDPDTDSDSQTWREWVAGEGRRRTLAVAYCFVSLHSIAYNIPPMILNKDIGSLSLPAPESHWRAENEGSWQKAREQDVYRKTQFHKARKCLFTSLKEAVWGALSSFGNYVLIHCIIQEIFFARQLYFASNGSGSSLAPEVLSQFDLALRNWQRSWEATKDSSFDPSAPGGPLSFNATALFRLAYIRLHIDLGPCRQLESRDHMRIAHAFRSAPLLERSPYVARAVLQCAHSLSIPVRIGIEFVARTQTLTWSIVHSLSNLECALFLGKWLETIASVLKEGGILQHDEKRLLAIISSIVNETDLGFDVQEEREQVKKIRRISSAVMRLWAYTFQGGSRL